jgi:hypothetical protein
MAPAPHRLCLSWDPALIGRHVGARPPGQAPPQASLKRDSLQTLGGVREHRADPVAGKEPVIPEEEHIEEIFNQLWSIPNPSTPRIPTGHGDSHLVWIRSDLVRERKIRPKDCYSVSKHHRIDNAPKTLSFSRDIWVGAGKRQTFIEAVKKKAMAEG